MSKSKVKDAWSMPGGSELEMGNWELQIDAKMDEQSFRSVLPSMVPMADIVHNQSKLHSQN